MKDEEREVTLEELQNMLKRGEISSDQFVKSVIEAIGEEAFYKAYGECMKAYFKDLDLNKECPVKLDMPKKQISKTGYVMRFPNSNFYALDEIPDQTKTP
jgi:hypothetical protein